MIKLIYSIIAMLCYQIAQAQQEPTSVKMTASYWNVSKDVKFETFNNRQTMFLPGGRAMVKNLEFTNGVIEVDVYAETSRSFAGITFRKQNTTMEEVYMRLHKSRQADAVQYTPIFNNESNWQLYNGYQANVSFKALAWNTLRLEVMHNAATIFVNGKKVLEVDHLRTDNPSGKIGLFALFGSRFSNFRYTTKPATETRTPTAKDQLYANTISTWNITQAKPYNANTFQLKHFLNENYTKVHTEASGLLPISKYISKSNAGNFEENSEDFTLASTTILTDKETTKRFSFDYSDKIIVYFYGKERFKGNNAFRTKGVNIWDI
ncbi:MAG: family 16 glycoside hydrolase [Leeuwenhoekiella sp.]